MPDDEPLGSDPADIDAYIAGLAEGGEDGPVQQFTIDRDRAREQLARFQLAEPHQYVTELIQAAVASGASRVDVELDTDDVRIRFDGSGFTVHDFELLYEPGSPDADPAADVARRQLALGLNLALGVRPKFVRVVSSGLSGAAELVLVPDRPDHYKALDQVPAGTTIHLRRQANLKLMAKAAQNVLGALPEARLIRERCRFSGVEITVGGRSVVQPEALPAPERRVSVDHQGCPLVAGFVDNDAKSSVVHLVQHGVCIDTVELDCGPPHGFVAVAQVEPLQRDLSLQTVVRDEALEDWIAVALEARRQALAVIEREVCDAAAEETVPAWLRRVLRLAVAHGEVEVTDELGRMSLWPVIARGVGRQSRSLQQLQRRAAQQEQLDCITEAERGFSDAQITGWSPLCVVLADEHERLSLWGNHQLTVVPLEADAVQLVVGAARWSWLKRLRGLKWPLIAVGISLAAVVIYYMFVVSSREPVDEPLPQQKPGYRQQCRDGGAEACMRYARTLAKLGLAETYDETERAFKRACSLGNRNGCREAEILLSRGSIHPSPKAKEHVLLTRACGLGELKACGRAVRLFTKLPSALGAVIQGADEKQCERRGTRFDCLQAGLRSLVGFGARSMPHSARARLNKACQQELLVACAFIDTEVGENHNSEAPEAWAGAFLEEACKAGKLAACSQLSMVVRHGWGATKDVPRSLRLARRACDGGLPLACRRVGNELGARKGKKNELAALAAYERACKVGDATSCNYCSQAYSGSKPVIAKDEKKAARFDRRACKLKSGLGCYNLGLSYQKGWGVKKDLVRARKWFQEACEYDHHDGCYARDQLPAAGRPRPQPRPRPR